MIYLDYAATTPMMDEALEQMLPYLSQHFGNPSSVYATGRDAKKGLEEAREKVASAAGAQPAEIIFTAGGTEADNLALKGAVAKAEPKRNHIITTSVEHHAVLHVAEWLESQGCRVTFLPVSRDGVVDLDALKAALSPQTCLVSVMLANNEIGVLQPMAEIGKICKSRGVLLHTDATQAVGRISVDVEQLQVDLLSLAAHKMYGPKGVGALYVRRRNPLVRLEPQIEGGGQEGGL
ncbi:MAG: cysteine desulfurase, partial [Actinobacteria bacterium]|nr:cysteine desulfurase [Actinomycetota bacterium]